MDFQSLRDIPIKISSANVASERRITPTWTLTQLKAKLEPITGIPPSAQRLILKSAFREDAILEAQNEEETLLSAWSLKTYAEIQVDDTRPSTARAINFTDLSWVEKYTMPAESYSALPNSVLAWKKANKLGRFDSKSPEIDSTKVSKLWSEIEARQIDSGKRCRLGSDSTRRGTVSYVGEVQEIPGLGGPWVGIILDEPMGKNDGSISGKRYFQCPAKCGVFVRPERVEIGHFGRLLEEDIEDFEEI